MEGSFEGEEAEGFEFEFEFELEREEKVGFVVLLGFAFELEDKSEIVSVIWMGSGGKSASGMGAVVAESDEGKTIRSFGTYFGFASLCFFRLDLLASFELPALESEELLLLLLLLLFVLLRGEGLELVIPLMIAEPNGMDVFFGPFRNVSLSPLPPLYCVATSQIRKNTLNPFHPTSSTIDSSAAYSLPSFACELGFQVRAQHWTVAWTSPAFSARHLPRNSSSLLQAAPAALRAIPWLA